MSGEDSPVVPDSPPSRIAGGGRNGDPPAESSDPSVGCGSAVAPSISTRRAPLPHTMASSTAVAARAARTAPRTPSADTSASAPAAGVTADGLALRHVPPDRRMGPRECLLPADQVSGGSSHSPPGRTRRRLAAQPLTLPHTPHGPRSGPALAATSISRRGPIWLRQSGPVPGRHLHACPRARSPTGRRATARSRAHPCSHVTFRF
jgi:hypothetical protein